MKHLFALILIVLLLPVTVFAHSGKTDSNGGHWDHSKGEYHYHHGYPAHDHYDMDGDGFVDCPYLFDDKTDHTPGGSGSSSESIIRPSPTLEPTESSPPQSNPPADNSGKRQAVGRILLLILDAFIAVFCCEFAGAFLLVVMDPLFKLNRKSSDTLQKIGFYIIMITIIAIYLANLLGFFPFDPIFTGKD